jgi:hypothetical protein
MLQELKHAVHLARNSGNYVALVELSLDKIGIQGVIAREGLLEDTQRLLLRKLDRLESFHPFYVLDQYWELTHLPPWAVNGYRRRLDVVEAKLPASSSTLYYLVGSGPPFAFVERDATVEFGGEEKKVSRGARLKFAECLASCKFSQTAAT